MGIEVDSKGTCTIEGVEYPAVGFGTYPLTGNVCTTAVSQAAKYGYRIIDTATFYQNFEAISKGLKPFGREKFYIISKVWPNAQTPDRLREDLKNTLEQLHTTYLDAYLIHWPNSRIPIEDTLQAMNELRQQGKIRHIGLSNVTVNHLRRALEVGVPISWVQNEMHPYFYEPDLLAFCKEHSIVVQAWSPLGRGGISDDPFLTKIGKKYGKTASQVALRWIVQHGCIPLPGSKNEKHIQQNIDIMNFSLTNEEMAAIDQRAENGKRARMSSDEFDYSYEQCWPKRT